MSLSVLKLLQSSAATSKQIQLATGLSQAVVSRTLNKLGDKVIKINKQRPPKYFLSREAFGAGNKIALIGVDAMRNNTLLGYLRPLGGGGFYVEGNNETPAPLLGCNKGFYSDLPYFLDDLRPQGFLGKQIAKKMSELPLVAGISFPINLNYWNNEHIGRYIIANNENLTGNILLGEKELMRIKNKPKAVSRNEYSSIAQEVLNGENFGSSAGGEQPKFTAFNQELKKHVIVKFSPAGKSEIATRWRDILLSEHYAAIALNQYNIPAAQTKIIEQDGRLFLESVRFDRKGLFGKLSMVSLLAIDSEFVGMGDSWVNTCEKLFEQKLLSQDDLQQVKLLSAFGQLINNVDMHLGNLSLGVKDNLFNLLPVYDMCCMGFAPKVSEVMPFVSKPRNIDGFGLNSEQKALIIKVVTFFWKNLAREKKTSTEFGCFISRMSNYSI